MLFVAFFFAGFLGAGYILQVILSLVKVDQVVIATTSPFQFTEVAVDIGFFVAIMFTVPYVIYGLYAFIAPALTRREKIQLFKSVPVSIFLFALGFLYGFFILYYAFELLAAMNTSLGIQNIWNISQFLSQMFITAALLGFVFEFPLVLSLCIRAGLVTQQFLKDKRRLAYFAIFVLVSLLPPTDGVSLIAMSLPLMVLYEVTILVNNKKYHVWTGN